MSSTQTITIRNTSAADAGALQRLAELDSTRLGEGSYMIAEVGGTVRAAVEVETGTVIADPFQPSAGVTDLLRSATAAEKGGVLRRLRARTGRPRPALGAA